MGYFTYIINALRPHRRRLVLAMVCWLGILIVDLGSPLGVAVLIDVIIGQGRFDLLTPLIGVFLLLPFIAAAMHMVNGYLMTIVSQRLVFDIRLDLYRRVQTLSCRYLQSMTTGKLMERLRGDVQQLQLLLTTQTPAILVQVLTGLIMVGIMLSLSARLTLLVLATIVLYAVNYKWFVKRIRVVQRRYRRKIETLSGVAQERLSGNIIVKAFGTERMEARHFVKRNFVAERIHHRFRMLNLAYGTTSSAIAWFGYLMVTVLGTYLAVQGHMTYGAVTAFAAFTMRLLAPAVQLAELSNQIQQAKVSLDRIFELMRAEPDVIEQDGIRLEHLRGEVAFRNVSFEYEPDEPVLRHMSFIVQPGQTVALVGHTGCGKSTIASLLYRYFDVQHGSVEIDGHDIKEFAPRWYRQQLGMVPQEPLVLDTTIAQNIAYGRPNASADQIENAARLAELGNLIDSLPNGINSVLGEGGITLSVGEKQRLCIARAIFAEPAILILDEATSSLDPTSESLIQLALKRVMRKRTCFVIAHRLSTIVDADLILVIDEGQILEMGNHAQLMAKPMGQYRELVLTQAGAQRALEIA